MLDGSRGAGRSTPDADGASSGAANGGWGSGSGSGGDGANRSGTGSGGSSDASARDTGASGTGTGSTDGGGARPSAGCGKGGQARDAGNQVVSIDIGGTTRTYFLSSPARYTSAIPQPVYFVFHGRGSDHTSVTGLGLQDQAVGVFPDGLNRSGTIGWDTAVNGTDVAMFDAVLKSVADDYCVDLGRVYATGFSWGASMANALGCFRADVLRAFASVEGGILFGNGSNDCKGPIPGSINQYKQDPTVSFATGQAAEQFFVSVNSATNPRPCDAPNPCVIFTGKAPLVWCTPDGAMHAWPPYATAAIKRFFGTL